MIPGNNSWLLILLQVLGDVAWAVTVALAEAKAGQSGVPTWRAGRLCTPTATRASGPPTSGTASGCVTGTRTCMIGVWAPGTSACQSRQWPSEHCVRPHAVAAVRRASRPGRWAVYSRRMARRQRTSSASTLSPNQGWSRPAWFPALRTVLCLSTPPGPPAPRPVGQDSGTESAAF